ncbi:hypothetical protein ABGB12_10810 [Actinocorallia sp. B10E7]|uniref:hypothetical protein n=1 Tax=Actinocorallia sp. B10E7 TaxID=3153558 RepID=UPI00325F64A6
MPGARLRTVRPGKPFTLAPGWTVRLRGGPSLTFVAVESDSRCPVDVQCVWPGDAVVTVSTGRSTFRLHTMRRTSVHLTARLSLSLLALSPDRRDDLPIRQDRYRARLRVDRE